MKIRVTRWGASKKSGPRTRGIAALAVLALFATGAVVASAPAYATDYPSWADVAAARNNEAAAQNQIAQIQSLLAGLEADVTRTAADADAKGTVYRDADQKFQEAAQRASQLQTQADAAKTTADTSKQSAGQMLNLISRTGNGNISASLLVSTGSGKDLLNHLDMANKLTEQAHAIFAKATQDANTAQALTNQADVAKTMREQLKNAAEKAFQDAQAAATAAATALTTQQAHQAELQQQLIVLTENRAATEADFVAGIKARTGSGAALDGAEISLSGYGLPAYGPITDNFGYRYPHIPGTNDFHSGTDIGAGCGNNIYAAHSGTVVYAGRNGTYGNWIEIDDGDGISTGYAHIVDGGILVSIGQSVDVGTNIAHVGSTGASTGCHLHFEVRVNGAAVNAVPFMADQGITIG